MSDMTFYQKIKSKADNLNAALKADYGYDKKTASLTKGSPEWVSWHAGYKTALYDVLDLMESELRDCITDRN